MVGSPALRVCCGLTFATLACIACKKANSLEGTWIGGAMGNITFSGNNFSMDGQIPGGGQCTFSGNFTLNGDQLNLLPSDVKIKGKDPSQQAAIDQRIEQFKPQILKVVTDENPVIVTWKDEDHLTMKPKTMKERELERVEISGASKQD